MKEMVYDGQPKREVLDHGTMDGVEYAILSYGSHPCAYIMIPDNSPFGEKGFDQSSIGCHGGIAYCMKGLHVVDEEARHLWIGWDYNHCGDFSVYPNGFSIGGQKYTTEEIRLEVKRVIEHLLLKGLVP